METGIIVTIMLAAFGVLMGLMTIDSTLTRIAKALEERKGK
jgi:hypothetical protein